MAQSFNLIVCDGTASDPCTFNKLMVLVRNLINMLVVLSTFLAAAVFAFAGFKLLASGGNESAKKDATSMLTKVVIGYLWILGAWVVVYTISSILLKDEFFFNP